MYTEIVKKDPKGRVTQITYGDGSWVKHKYKGDLLIETTSSKNISITYTYDDKNKIISSNSTDGKYHSYQYNENGQEILHKTNNMGSEFWRETEYKNDKIIYIGTSHGEMEKFTYNDNGDLLRYTHSINGYAEYNYNDDNILLSSRRVSGLHPPTSKTTIKGSMGDSKIIRKVGSKIINLDFKVGVKEEISEYDLNGKVFKITSINNKNKNSNTTVITESSGEVVTTKKIITTERYKETIQLNKLGGMTSKLIEIPNKTKIIKDDEYYKLGYDENGIGDMVISYEDYMGNYWDVSMGIELPFLPPELNDEY